MYYYVLGENLKKLRKKRGLTQKAFGDRFGLSKAVVSKYENGMGHPDYDVLIRIAQFFGVTTDELLGVERANSIDVTGLTESQIGIIHQLIAEFKNTNKV